MQRLINVTKGVTKGPSYLVLVWDPKKGFEATNAKHGSHPTYLTHIGIGFLGICTH